jgi:phasin family protein
MKDSKMSNENQNNNSNMNFSHQQNGEKRLDTATASTNTFPGGFQAIATAYGEYTKKSFEDTKSFVEKLSAVRSPDKAIEVQTEFAKTAYETFVSESQKIGALYVDLAKQSYKPFGGFVAKMTPTNQ